MAQKLYDETYIKNVADAIRLKNGKSDKYTIGQMAEAIRDISGTPILEPLAVTDNGIYVPGTGVDGFNQVSVNVSGGTGNTGLVEPDGNLISRAYVGCPDNTSSTVIYFGNSAYASEYDKYIMYAYRLISRHTYAISNINPIAIQNTNYRYQCTSSGNSTQVVLKNINDEIITAPNRFRCCVTLENPHTYENESDYILTGIEAYNNLVASGLYNSDYTSSSNRIHIVFGLYTPTNDCYLSIGISTSSASPRVPADIPADIPYPLVFDIG